MIFFILSALTGLGLGFTGFQIIAACDKLGFATIDYMGVVLILMSAPLAILSINHVSKGYESLKFTGGALMTYLCFMFFQGPAIHALIGASSLFHPLYSMVSVVFMLIFFVTCAVFLIRLIKKDYQPSDVHFMTAIAGLILIFALAWPVTLKLRADRNDSLIKFHQKWVANPGVSHEDNKPLNSGFETSGTALSVQLCMPEKAKIKQAFIKSAEYELLAVKAKNIKTVVLNDQFSSDKTNSIINTKIIDLINAAGLSLFIQDSMGPWPGKGRLAWSEFYKAHKERLVQRARELKPAYYSLAGAPEYYRLLGVTGEFNPDDWANHILDCAREVKKVSPATVCGFYVSVKEFYNSNINRLRQESNAAQPYINSPAIKDTDISEPPDICGGYFDAVKALYEKDQELFARNIRFAALHLYFDHQIKKLEHLIALKCLGSAAEQTMGFQKDLKIYISECWNGWALAPPRNPENDALWIEAVWHMARQAGVAGFFITPFGNFYKDRYFNSFGLPFKNHDFQGAGPEDFAKMPPFSRAYEKAAQLMSLSGQ